MQGKNLVVLFVLIGNLRSLISDPEIRYPMGVVGVHNRQTPQIAFVSSLPISLTLKTGLFFTLPLLPIIGA
jgi:hypothetical protein